MAYSIETVLAEKLETIIARATLNTRMRDFYDIYVLNLLYGKGLTPEILGKSLQGTSKKGGTISLIGNAVDICNEVEDSMEMQRLWTAYQKKFSYARYFSWCEIMTTVKTVFILSGAIEASYDVTPIK